MDEPAGGTRYAVATGEGGDDVEELPADFVARLRINRRLWERYGELVGDGSTRAGGRSPRLAAYIRSEVERLEKENQCVTDRG